MTSSEILVCREPGSPKWGLGALDAPGVHVTLIGWPSGGQAVDAGVPGNVAAVLARALTVCARVTFPCSRQTGAESSDWTGVDGDFLRSLGVGGLSGRLAALLARSPAEIVLRSTRNAASAVMLFDDSSFPWWMQGQIVMLSAPDDPPPSVDRGAVLGLLAEDWAARGASLTALRVQGLMRPGVDGALAGVSFYEKSAEAAFLQALEREAHGADFAFRAVAEPELTERLAR